MPTTMLNLSENERAIIVCIEQNARLSYKEISKYTGISAITVQRAIARMKFNGILKSRYPYVDPAKLGLSINATFVTLNPNGFIKLPDLIANLLKDNQVEWCSTLAGRFNLGLSFYRTSNLSRSAFLERFTRYAGKLIHERKQSTRVESIIFGRRYLSKEEIPTKKIIMGREPSIETIDELDHKILTTLCNTGLRSERFLSRELNVPAATINRRLSRLEENGVIQTHIYDLNSSIIEFRSKLLFSASTSTNQLYAALVEFSQKNKNVVFLARYEGAWDAEVTVESESSLELESIIQMLLAKVSKEISAVEVLGVFRDVKYQNYPGIFHFGTSSP